MSMQGSVTVFLGPPGIGKGTQAKILVEKLNAVHLSTGDIIREEKNSGSIVGQKMLEIGWSDPGLLDRLVLQPLQQRVAQSENKIIIFDGFPRSRIQSEWLDDCLARNNRTLKHVVEFYGDDESVIHRMLGRYSCVKKECQAIYHDTEKPTLVANRCDICGSAEFFRRREDTPEIVQDRLTTFRTASMPMIDYYASRGLLRRINGLAPLQDVSDALIKLFLT